MKSLKRYKILQGCLLALSATTAFSGTMGPVCPPGKIYVGGFAGGGELSGLDVNQYGTTYPGHAATSSWQVKVKPQYFNMGTAGIQFDL